MSLSDMTRAIENLAKRVRSLETQESLVVLASTSPIYLGSPVVDGSWRIVRSGNNLNFERREAGVWVPKQVITP